MALWSAVDVSDARAGSQFSDNKTVIVRFQPGNPERDGYESATIDVKYRFGECFGTVDMQHLLLPDSLRTHGFYWYHGKRWAIPDSVRPERITLLTFAGNVSGKGAVHDFSVLTSTRGVSCLDSEKLGKFAQFWEQGATAEEKKWVLTSLNIATEAAGFFAEPLISSTVERYISGLLREEQEKPGTSR